MVALCFNSTGCASKNEKYYNNEPEVINTPNVEDIVNLPIEEYKSPIDFEKLKLENQDAYAWVKVLGTDIDFPIYQSGENDKDDYYLRINRFHESDSQGEVYTQKNYNTKSFEDKHTVIYGHNVLTPLGGVFSPIEEFADKEFFNNNNEIVIYLPEKELHYQIFAFYKWNDEHLLYKYPQDDEETFENYLMNIISNADSDANINETIKLSSNSNIITLSTCVSLNGSKRYLLQAVLLDEE